MAEKKIEIKVVTKSDTSEVDDLNELLTEIQDKAKNMDASVTVHSDDDEILETEASIDDLDSENVDIPINVDSSEVDELITELANIEMGTSDADFEEIILQLEEAETEAQQLGDALNNIDDTNINTASSDTNELSNSLSDASENANELSNSMGLIDSAVYMDMANQIGALGDQAEGMAQDMNNASITVGQLATQTGIAEPEMRALIADISNVTFPQSEAMMYVKSLDQIGISSKNLGKSATDLDKINDAFFHNANTVNSLGQELSVLGVDMNNISSAFNALAYANSNTVGGMQNYYTFLKKYDAQFNELGYDVDQASIIIAAATQKYGGGRAALSGLSDALKNANGDTRALEQSLGIQAGALDNASNITGKYAGQLESLANEEMEHKTITERLGAVWEDLSLQFSPVLGPLGEFVGLIGQIGQTSLAINSILTLAETFGLLETATISETIAQWGLNFAFLSNPITWVVVAIIALIAVLGYLYFNNEQVRAAVDSLGQSFILAGQIIYTSFLNAINWIIGALQNFYNYVMTLGGLLPQGVNVTGNQIIDSILAFLAFFATLPIQIGIFLINTLAKALGFKGNFVQTMIGSASESVRGFANAIRGIGTALQNCLNWAYNLMMSHPIVSAAVALGRAIANGFSALGLGQHSPGRIFKSMKQELDWTEEEIEGSSLPISSARLGSSIVDSFGEPKLGLEYSPLNNNRLLNRVTGLFNGLNDDFNFNTASTGNELLIKSNDENPTVIQNFNFEGCTFDKDERVQEILDVFHNEIHWNNTTAGRTV